MSIQKMAYFCLGWVCLGLGILGVFLPLLPTTPFILVAAFGFSKSSERFHAWLLEHKVFGQLVRDWQERGAIRTQAKVIATVSIVLMLSLSFYLVSPPMAVTLVILLSVVAVMSFIWTRPSH